MFNGETMNRMRTQKTTPDNKKRTNWPSNKTMRTITVKNLEKKADKLFQVQLIKLMPRSIISGEPTEVIHHYIYKSQSNNLRYDIDNGIPLTNKEHCRHHLSGDPSIVAGIIAVRGIEWHDSLQKKRRTICHLNKGYLQETITRLENLCDKN